MPRRRPFKSKAQAAFLFARKPAVAKRMVEEARKAGVKHPIRNLPKQSRRRS